MTSPTSPWNSTFADHEPAADFCCIWCARSLRQENGMWRHEAGESCLWDEFPLEVSHPFVSALLSRIRDDAMDFHGKMTEFGRVLSMFRPIVPASNRVIA